MVSDQLPLGSDPRTDILRRVHAAMIERFGRIVRPPAKRRNPVWTLVQGVIGARSKTIVSNTSTDRLLADYGSWEAVAEAPVDELTAILSIQTFPELSAQRLKDCLAAIIAERGAVDLRHLSNLPIEEAMLWLESLPGVARKIAAQVMNTSTFDRPVMVIETHHRRIMQRMGLIAPKADTARAFDVLMPILPEEWSAADMDEHHLLLKKVGQTHCRPARPLCSGCPLRADCETGRDA